MSRALLLVGSPKSGASASATFAAAVGQRLAARGWSVQTQRILPTFRDRERMSSLLSSVAGSDLVVLAFPVYVDSLPAPVLGFLEAWRDRRLDEDSSDDRVPRLAVLTQCGFPEARHCEVAIEVCRLFANEARVEWAGALAFGMGPSIAGGSLERSPLARVLPELDAAVAALAAGGHVPLRAREAFARPLAPAWAYPLVGRFVWTVQARQRGCSEPLTLRRYGQ